MTHLVTLSTAVTSVSYWLCQRLMSLLGPAAAPQVAHTAPPSESYQSKCQVLCYQPAVGTRRTHSH